MVKYAYFAGGCFWCIYKVFNENEKVISVRSGYSGGDEVNPTYEDVKNQLTGHRETIRIEYDDLNISYKELLEIYMDNVDLYDDGGQYIDRGHSYTLALFYTNKDELNDINEIMDRYKNEYGIYPYIEVLEFKSFFEASKEHQDYYLNHPEEFQEEIIKSGRNIACKWRKKK